MRKKRNKWNRKVDYKLDRFMIYKKKDIRKDNSRELLKIFNKYIGLLWMRMS